MSLFNIFKKDQQLNKQKPKVRKDTTFYSQTQTVLPDNFAQNVMELEMQLEFVESYDMEVVHKLNQMYRIAIEHYINVDPRKANHFQRKLTSLLTNPHTLQIMQKIEKQKTPSSKPVQNTTHYNTSLKQQLNKFNSQSQILVKSIIEGSQKKVQRSSKIVYSNINQQEDMLRKRLEQRSKSRSNNKDQQRQKSPAKKTN